MRICPSGRPPTGSSISAWPMRASIVCGRCRSPSSPKFVARAWAADSRLSLSCDLAYASEDAFFGEPEVKFGGSTMSPLLAWALPPRHFKELLLTGRFIDAKRAETWGLINEAVSADALDARVDQVVRHMCLLPPGTLARNKSLLNRFYDVMGLCDPC